MDVPGSCADRDGQRDASTARQQVRSGHKSLPLRRKRGPRGGGASGSGFGVGASPLVVRVGPILTLGGRHRPRLGVCVGTTAVLYVWLVDDEATTTKHHFTVVAQVAPFGFHNVERQRGRAAIVRTRLVLQGTM